MNLLQSKTIYEVRIYFFLIIHLRYYYKNYIVIVNFNFIFRNKNLPFLKNNLKKQKLFIK
jgi:hypothetical protein